MGRKCTIPLSKDSCNSTDVPSSCKLRPGASSHHSPTHLLCLVTPPEKQLLPWMVSLLNVKCHRQRGLMVSHDLLAEVPARRWKLVNSLCSALLTPFPSFLFGLHFWLAKNPEWKICIWGFVTWGIEFDFFSELLYWGLPPPKGLQLNIFSEANSGLACL